MPSLYIEYLENLENIFKILSSFNFSFNLRFKLQYLVLEVCLWEQRYGEAGVQLYLTRRVPLETLLSE